MNQETKTESEMLAQLKASSISLAPVNLTMREISAGLGDTQYDAIVDATWNDDEAAFAVECKRLGTIRTPDDSPFWQIKKPAIALGLWLF